MNTIDTGALRGHGERLLLVCETAEAEEVLRPALVLAGYDVETVSTGRAALERMDRVRYHLAVVDTTLPGLESVPRRRPRKGRAPVLFLAAGEQVARILPELGRNGRDYLTKPLRVTDLLARVRLLLGRGTGPGRSVLRHGDLALDESEYRAWRGGRELGLTPAEYRLLRHLLVNTGTVLSKEGIARHVWQDPRGDNAIERLVSRLRRKVGPDLVRTHRGFGYVLERTHF